MSNFNLQKLIRPNVARLKPYSSARDEFKSSGAGIVFLDANENPYPTEVNRYPDPQQRDLKEELGKLKNIDPCNILIGNGSDEVLDLLFRAFCEPKIDSVITLPPTYGMYGVLAAINDIENREVFLTPGFEPNVPEILDSVDKNTKIIFLCSPNNPTGNSFSEENISQILESFKGLVVIDEAYIDFSKKESWLTKLNNYPNLVITQTLSKAYGMAGIRMGICYASPKVISILNKIKPPYNVNKLSQNQALERLKNSNSVIVEVAEILKERKALLNLLLEVNFIEKIFPSDANFILVKVDDANKRYDQLLAKGIVSRNRTNQPLCENTLRITVGTKQENQKLIKALQEII